MPDRRSHKASSGLILGIGEDDDILSDRTKLAKFNPVVRCKKGQTNMLIEVGIVANSNA